MIVNCCFNMKNIGITRIALLASVVCSILAITSHNSREVRWIQATSYGDVTRNVISSISDVISEMNCGRKCRNKAACLSFSYNSLARKCHLHSTKLMNSSSPPLLGWSHYVEYSDPCPADEGYVLLGHLNLCFKFFNEDRNWTEARDVCVQSGSRVIVLDTGEKATAVYKYIKNFYSIDACYYIGLTDEVDEGVFVWSNGDTVDFSLWNDNEPNNSGGEDCVQSYEGFWNDCPCSSLIQFVCEKI